MQHYFETVEGEAGHFNFVSPSGEFIDVRKHVSDTLEEYLSITIDENKEYGYGFGTASIILHRNDLDSLIDRLSRI